MGFGLILQEEKEEAKTEEAETTATEEVKASEEVKPATEEKPAADEAGKAGKAGKGGKKEKDQKPKPKRTKMKTRSGETVRLMDLLNEARDRALKQFVDRAAEKADKVQIDESQLKEAAEIMGISSIKYFDLKQNRTQDYVFDFDHMLNP